MTLWCLQIARAQSVYSLPEIDSLAEIYDSTLNPKPFIRAFRKAGQNRSFTPEKRAYYLEKGLQLTGQKVNYYDILPLQANRGNLAAQKGNLA